MSIFIEHKMLKHKIAEIKGLLARLEAIEAELTTFLKLDGSTHMTGNLYVLGRCYVKVDGVTARYNIRKDPTGDLIFFIYNQTLNKFFMGVGSIPFQIIGNPITFNSQVDMGTNRLLNAINGILRLPDTRPVSPSAGDVRYDPATDTFEIYDGVSWNPH